MKYRNLDASELSVDTVKLLDINLGKIIYRVDVPNMFTITEAERNTFGTLAQDDKDIRMGIESSYNSVYWPLARIIEVYTSGGNIRIPESKDLVGMYELIVDYLYIQQAILISLYHDTYMDKEFVKKCLDFHDYLIEKTDVIVLSTPESTLEDIAMSLTSTQSTTTNENDYDQLRNTVRYTTV